MIGGAMTYNLATLFIKLSILSFYLRFSVDRWFRITVYVVMSITVGYTIPNAFLFSYICQPHDKYWDWSLQGTCINAQAAFDAANILNMATDYMILVLPIWMLRPLRVPLLKKIGVALILMAGGLYVFTLDFAHHRDTNRGFFPQCLRHQHNAHDHRQDGRRKRRCHLALPGELDLVVRLPAPCYSFLPLFPFSHFSFFFLFLFSFPPFSLFPLFYFSPFLPFPPFPLPSLPTLSPFTLGPTSTNTTHNQKNTDTLTHDIYSIVEVFVGIVCACLPCLKAFSKRFFPNLFLFSPSFQQRVSSSFPFSSFRLDTVTATANGYGNGNGNTSGNNDNNNNDGGNGGNGNASDGGIDGENDVGGRRAWWRLRRGASGEGSQGGGTGAGGSDSGDGEVKSQGRSTEGASVDGKGSGSDGDLEAGGAGDKRSAGTAVVEKES
jgi:hypothetical protein